jgi:hypothetical protein
MLQVHSGDAIGACELKDVLRRKGIRKAFFLKKRTKRLACLAVA